MKKLLLTLALTVASVVAGGLPSVAGEAAKEGEKAPWRQTFDKAAGLTGDTGIAGFMKKTAPAYLTGDFDEADRPAAKPFEANRNGYYDRDCKWHGGYFDDVGNFVAGHEVKVLGLKNLIFLMC